MTFQKATKQSARLRLALIGPPGSGKTWTALVVAAALGKRVAVIDTERGSASKYAGDFDFDVMELRDSFHPRRYIDAIQEATAAGYDAVVIDSLSHAWIGKDGGLDLHDKAVDRQKTKNSFTAWAEVTPHHTALVDALLQTPMHLIATMRSKVEYVQEKDERGRTSVRKVGTAPQMRDGVEYEFDVVGDIDQDHTLVITKTRCSSLSGTGGVIRLPGKEFTSTLKAWLGDSPAPAAKPALPAPAPQANGQHKLKGPQLPASGEELSVRLRTYDAKLAKEGTIQAGELVAFVVDAGKAMGYDPDLAKWSGPAIQFAVDQAKAFSTSPAQLGQLGYPVTPPIQRISAAQHKEICELLRTTGEDPEEFCRSFSINDTDELPKSRMEAAVEYFSGEPAGI